MAYLPFTSTGVHPRFCMGAGGVGERGLGSVLLVLFSFFFFVSFYHVSFFVEFRVVMSVTISA